MLNKLIIIGIIFLILIILIIVLAIVSKNKKKNNVEPEASILDVAEVGVPNTSELKDFSYGYEKEETIIMNPITESNKNEEIEKDEEKSENNE